MRTYAILSCVLPCTQAERENRSIFLNFLIARLPAPRKEYLSPTQALLILAVVGALLGDSNQAFQEDLGPAPVVSTPSDRRSLHG